MICSFGRSKIIQYWNFDPLNLTEIWSLTIFWPFSIWFKLYPHLNEAKTKGPSISKARHSVDYCPLATRKDTTHIQNIGVMREKSSKRQKKNRFFGSSKNEQKKSKIAASLCPSLWQLGVLWTFRSDWHITWTNTTHKCSTLGHENGYGEILPKKAFFFNPKII